MSSIAVLADAHAMVHSDQLRNDAQRSSNQRDNRMEYKKKRGNEGEKEGKGEREKVGAKMCR